MTQQVTRRILVVDDEPDLRSLLTRFLGARGFLVHEAADGAAMKSRLAEGPIDMVVLDVSMPGEDGLTLLAALRAAGDDVPVLMLTGRDSLNDRLAGLSRGADDYLTKPFEPHELLARVRAILRRTPVRAPRDRTGQPSEPRTVRLGACRFDPDAGRLATAEGGDVPLSASELEFLRVLLRHARMPLTQARLHELVHGCPAPDGSRAIDAAVFRLRRKIGGAADAQQILRTLRGEGYALFPSA